MSRTSDTSEHYRCLREHYASIKAAVGIDCPGCKLKEPRRIPTRLIPGKTCKVCGTNYKKAKGTQ